MQARPEVALAETGPGNHQWDGSGLRLPGGEAAWRGELAPDETVNFEPAEGQKPRLRLPVILILGRLPCLGTGLMRGLTSTYLQEVIRNLSSIGFCTRGSLRLPMDCRVSALSGSLC